MNSKWHERKPAHIIARSRGRRRRSAIVPPMFACLAFMTAPATPQQNGNFPRINQTDDNPDLDLDDPLANIDAMGVDVSPALSRAGAAAR